MTDGYKQFAIHLNIVNMKETTVTKKIINDTECERKIRFVKDKIDLSRDYKYILGSYFKQFNGKELVRHQLESYNDFMENKIPDIISQANPLVVYHDYDHKFNKYKYEIQIRFKNPCFTEPIITENDGSSCVMTPNNARLRNFTYSVPLFINIEVQTIMRHGDNFEKFDIMKNTLSSISLGKIPIMLKSKYCVLDNINNIDNINNNLGECKYDPGGYFIINGNEKVIVAQEKIADNKLYIFRVNKTNNKTLCVAEIKSVSESKFTIPKNFSIKMIKKGNSCVIRASINNIKQEIPLFILFRALGIESDKDILKYIVNDLDVKNNKLIYSLQDTIIEGQECNTQSAAYEYIIKYIQTYGQPKDIVLDIERKKGFVKDILEKDFLPHISNNLLNKVFYLGYMSLNLLKCYLGFRDFDDRDSYTNKRVELSGILLANLFRQYFSKTIKDMRNFTMKECNTCHSNFNIHNIINDTNINKLLKPNTIETGLKFAMSTGNWGIKTSSNKVGIAQVLSRLNYCSTLSHLRRLAAQSEKTGKLVGPRKLHNTQFGIVCPAETPEGGSVGNVKNLAIMTVVTKMTNSYPVYHKILNNGLILLSEIGDDDGKKVSFDKICKYGKIFINGNWVGLHKNLNYLLDKLKNLRRLGIINIYTSLCWNIMTNELFIYTDGGRCARPLLIVNNRELRVKSNHINNLKNGYYKWDNLILGSLPNVNEYDNYKKNILSEGILEYLDVEESHNCLISMKQKDLKKNRYTHCEIHPSTILGAIASTIPLPDHNQSPRNTYQSAMGKQAMGVYSSNFRYRMDTLGHILSYPNKPLVQTFISNYLNMNTLPTGLNAIVAIATYSGYNEEDSVILNKSSIDRGLFLSTFYRSYRDDEKKIQSSGKEERFTKPDPKYTNGLKPCNYDKLETNGFVKENTFVNGDDIIVGKVFPVKSTGDKKEEYRDCSTALRANESGYIDKLFTGRNNEGHKFSKVRVRSQRVPTVGDKFSSRHGQKGTVGMVFRNEDMPYSKNGIVPDLIMNPHAIPSRMTIAQLIETLMGKVCVNLGGYGNGTPFVDCNLENIQDILEGFGYEKYGNEILYNGRTGKQMDVKIFMGPTYYQRLKHLVDDKIHSRSHGPIVNLTRQPSEGRARDGGLRFGEMERDCMISHGTVQFLKERMLDVSDNYRLFICSKCNMTGIVNTEKDIYLCKKCNNQSLFQEVRIPYACKLLLQEMESMSISPRIILN